MTLKYSGRPHNANIRRLKYLIYCRLCMFKCTLYIDRPFSILCMFTQLKTTWLSTDPLIPGMQPQFKHNMYFKGVAVVSEAIKRWKPLRAFWMASNRSFFKMGVVLNRIYEKTFWEQVLCLFWRQVCICQHLCRTHSHCYTSCRHTFSALCHSLSRLMW